jgi:Asp-tRNA(Asn)/Glu-tRNA(Gln) amidotransferase A subunit family amidase
MTERLFALTATELGAAYGRRELSPVEVTTAVLERIDAWEPTINAMFLIDREGALAQARSAEARWREGWPLSPLDGVPITLKDNIPARGMPSPIGTAASEPAAPALEDSPPTARVREAGCIVLGKTTMPDFGMLASGVSSLHGVTRNPWRPDRNSGGSSAGAGAGLAALYGPLALGTDIGGSVRLPAAYCGVFAHKPSLGRVPIHPPYPGRVTGPMTRTVRDTAMLMVALTRPDASDYMSLPYDPVDYPARLDRDLAGVRLGLLLDIGVGTPPEPEVRAAVVAAARLFAAQGAEVEEVAPFADLAMLEGLTRFFQARSCTEYLKLPPERQAKVLPFIRRWLLPALDWSAVQLFRAINEIPRLREAAVRACAPYDFVLSPTSPIPAYAAEAACPGDDPAHPFGHICFTAPFNQSEQPACSVACGFTSDGLPIGLQIIGQRFDDLGVLQMAHAYERLRPELPDWPEP